MCLHWDSASREIAAALDAAQELERQSHGQYDLDKLFLAGKTKLASTFPIANFTGALKVTNIPGPALLVSCLGLKQHFASLLNTHIAYQFLYSCLQTLAHSRVCHELSFAKEGTCCKQQYSCACRTVCSIPLLSALTNCKLSCRCRTGHGGHSRCDSRHPTCCL